VHCKKGLKTAAIALTKNTDRLSDAKRYKEATSAYKSAAQKYKASGDPREEAIALHLGVFALKSAADAHKKLGDLARTCSMWKDVLG
jgi:hypothetical protein